MKAFENYIKIDEAAKKWNVTPRCVQQLCAKGKIEGALQFGRDWMIPKNAKKPADGRTKEGRAIAARAKSESTSFPRSTPFLHMTDLYSVPGSSKKSISALSDNFEAQTLLSAELAYSRGEIDRVYETATYLLGKHSSFYAVLSAGMLLALCAIWRGDLSLWRRAKVHIAEASAKNDAERDIISFSITAVDSMLYDVKDFPDWFKIGCFEPLHKDSLPAAKVFYTKYLYAAAYAVATRQLDVNGLQGLTLMSMLPYTIEPMISQAVADNSVIAEAYLRLSCAAIYHTAENDTQAIRHIDRAIALTLPDKFYGLLAEYCRTLDPLLSQRLMIAEPSSVEEVRKLYKKYNEGWSMLSSSVRGKALYTTLSPREREVAKLAAFGMKNSEIAKKLNMSLSGVKQAISSVSSKTGMPRDEFAAIL